jgi:hypothetical protein
VFIGTLNTKARTKREREQLNKKGGVWDPGTLSARHYTTCKPNPEMEEVSKPLLIKLYHHRITHIVICAADVLSVPSDHHLLLPSLPHAMPIYHAMLTRLTAWNETKGQRRYYSHQVEEGWMNS